MTTPATMVVANTNLNERFRKEFVNDLPERLQAVEQLIMGLARQASLSDALGELFLAIHSIKGSSSTFGLQILAAICHPFEELIQEAGTAGAVSKDFIRLALDYLDLLRQCLDGIQSGNENYDQTEKQLVSLHGRAFRRYFSIAVAVNSRVLVEICRQAAKSYDARVVEFQDSLNAMQRVLSEPFSAMIVSSELYPLRGEALIAAINLSYRHGQGFRTILLSSNREKAGFVNRETDPDFVVVRDKDFLPNLASTLAAIHSQYRQGLDKNHDASR